MNSEGKGYLTDDLIINAINLLNVWFSGKLTQDGTDCYGNKDLGLE